MVFDKIVEGIGGVAPEEYLTTKKAWPKRILIQLMSIRFCQIPKKLFILNIFSSIELKHILVFKVVLLYG